ncbi:MAG: hypothetical protein JXR94_14610 [Candidatus Hydrogenedentes bacterium]|nr:hypothetical protein [Candidatus Hydrogenedentota bacterium]
MKSRISRSVRLLAAVSVLIVLCGCPLAAVTVIFDQGTCGYSGNYSELHESAIFGGILQLADDFTLALNQSTISSVRWWGAYRTGVVADDFTIRIFEDNGLGAPQTTALHEIHVGAPSRAATGELFEPNGWQLPIYRYTASIPAVTLAPDTRYHISILNDVGMWMWSSNGSATEGNDYGTSRTTLDGTWGAHGVDFAFQLRN